MGVYRVAYLVLVFVHVTLLSVMVKDVILPVVLLFQ
jgi:hypothetical protein